NNLHRKVGYWLGGLVILHPLLLTLGYAREHGVGFYAQFLDFLSHYEDVANALIGLILLFTVVIISLPWIRRMMRYETWHVLHLPIYLVVALVFGHQVNTASVSYGLAFYYWYAINFAVFGALIFYRFLSPLIAYRKHHFKVERLIQESPTVTSVYITGDRMGEFKFEAGQYIHVWFLRDKLLQGLWQPHPFSLSQGYNGKNIRLSIKNSGDYTSTIKDLRPGTKVLVEGPFGRFIRKAAFRSKFLFIAGGIGITPIRAMIEELHLSKTDAVLFYGARTIEELVFKNELDKFDARKHYILSAETGAGYESGYVDEEKLRRLCGDYANREIYICGPVPMMMSLVVLLRDLGVPRDQIHHEKFGY
ncbi:MAG TPA: ferredoxin reductase family protein, partial [Candidatus Paceibacterota bacterium]